VLASDVVPFAQEVTDGVNGLLVPPDDERALAGALRRLGDPEVRRRLADGVQTPDLSGPWAHYLGTIEALSLDESLLGPGPGPHPAADVVDTDDVSDATLESPDDDEGYADVPGSPVAQGSSRARSAAGSRTGRASDVRSRSEDLAARLGTTIGRGWGTLVGASRHRLRQPLASRRDVLDLRPEDLPDWVLATDVLGDPAEADDARSLARFLGLPRSIDGVSSWAALGALTAILRVRDDGRRSAVIVDETGSRSLLSRWARAVGFAPVEIEFTGAHPSVAALDVDTGSLDVIVRIHPRGCDGSDITQVLEQASWALRSGGLLIVTVPIGPPSAEGAVGPADVRGILARAHDLGFVLVGDLDGDVTARMREAAGRARADDAAYGLVRLTLRRR